MRFIIHFLILLFLFSCNQTPEKQSENSISDSDSQEIQNELADIMEDEETADIIENDKESITNKAKIQEEFETLDVAKFNDFLLSERAYDKVEIMLLFYPGEIEPPKDGEKTSYEEEILENGNTLITLIHYNLVNDSIEGYKYLMEIKKKNDKWMMVSAKRNWKYYKGKGHTDWGIGKSTISELKQNSIGKKTKEDDNFIFLTVGYFNIHLESSEEELTAKEVMLLFEPQEGEEGSSGNETETIQEEILPNGNTLVTLVRDNFMDDSVKGEQHIMELEKIDGKWNVLYAKKNWKCYKGRGHTDWGIELCL